MLFILAAAMLGGLAALALTVSISLPLALVAAPVVGSAAGLGAALVLARRRASVQRGEAPPVAPGTRRSDTV